MDLGLQGKVALVTGGSIGIGKGIAQMLAREGARVAVLARGREAIDATVAEIRAEGGDAAGFSCDVTKPAEIERVVAEIAGALGTVDILVNNTGGNGREPNNAKFEDLDDGKWQRVSDINLMATVRFSRAVLPGMQARHWGRIVNISSAAGQQPEAVYAHYNAMKAAVNNLTKSLSRSYGGDGITVNAVAPGIIWSEGFAKQLKAGADERGLTIEEAEKQFLRKVKPNNVIGRSGRVEEVGALVAFLCSRYSGFITGSVYRIDGGSVASV
jgi:NAD(P)-dependent dehydrogenase (short-subunit alcohol dehydrogenase family)